MKIPKMPRTLIAATPKGFINHIGLLDTIRMNRGLPRLTDKEREEERLRISELSAQLKEMRKIMLEDIKKKANT